MDLTGATIVFDLDGTLVDTAPDLYTALSTVLIEEGVAVPPYAGLRRLVGQGARALIDRSARLDGREYAPEALSALTERFIEVYRQKIAVESRPFPFVEQALDDLLAAGATLSVCTNKRTELSVRLLEALGMKGRFSAIVGADAVADRKPAPGHYRAAVAAAKGDVSRSVMVGDSAADVSAAKSVGAPVIVMRHGYCEGEVEALGADLLLESFSELWQGVTKLLSP